MYYFIVNPKARSGAGLTVWGQVRRELLRREIPFKAWKTKYAGHARKIAKELTSCLTSTISLNIIGGDGSINEVLDGIQDFQHVILGYIPTGSGNDFSRSMGIPSDSVAALNCILKGHYSSIDIGYREISGHRRRFGVSCGMGLDASVYHEALSSPAKKILNKFHLGKFTYLAIALKQLILCQPVPMTLHLDGQRSYRFRRAFFAAVMNQPYEGGGFMMTPKATASDHMLDVIVISDLYKLKILVCLPLALFGMHTSIKGVHIFRCKSIDIQCPVPLCVHQDGESGGFASELHAGIEKSSLKVTVPMI